MKKTLARMQTAYVINRAAMVTSSSISEKLITEKASMYRGTYKYHPADLASLQNMSEDLEVFYDKLKIYADDKSDSNWFSLWCCWHTLFFTLKHREVEGGCHLL